MDSACCASSSMTSIAGGVGVFSNARRTLVCQSISVFPSGSGRLHAGHPAQGLDEPNPGRSLTREGLSSVTRQTVIAPAALAGALNPAAFDQTAILEPVERWIEGRGIERDGAAGSDVGQPRDFVPVPVALIEQRQNQKFRAAPFELPRQRIDAHMWTQNISQGRTRGLILSLTNDGPPRFRYTRRCRWQTSGRTSVTAPGCYGGLRGSPRWESSRWPWESAAARPCLPC